MLMKMLWLFLALAAVVCIEAVETGPYKILEVIEGDCVKVENEHGTQVVRLLYVDTPEILADKNGDQSHGEMVKQWLSTLLPSGKNVKLRASGYRIEKDDTGRMLAEILVEKDVDKGFELLDKWYSVSLALIEAGQSAYWRKNGNAPDDMHVKLYNAQSLAYMTCRGVWKTNQLWMLLKARAHIDEEFIKITDPAQRPLWANDHGKDTIGWWVEIVIRQEKQRLRWIPPGTFVMGSPDDEKDRNEEEELRNITLTQGYWMADTECSQEFWTAVVGEAPQYFQDYRKNMPVHKVSWFDCQQFLESLNKRVANMSARLPTEAEWEYACRAGSKTAFNQGDALQSKDANFGNHHMYDAESELYIGPVTSVGSFNANSWGLYDMHGNVFEWCEDWYASYFSHQLVNPDGPLDGPKKVLRGGGWGSGVSSCRSATRSAGSPKANRIVCGFRFVISL
ncbi:MAG: SUMF1/EgtB/PvdO family nonheme iron enzyme [Planctomycetes bacterium]|nr:SUMF1/EgtB/PvdO family nonheme iron enzyme [Planctomycetota bacterium]